MDQVPLSAPICRPSLRAISVDGMCGNIVKATVVDKNAGWSLERKRRFILREFVLIPDAHAALEKFEHNEKEEKSETISCCLAWLPSCIASWLIKFLEFINPPSSEIVEPPAASPNRGTDAGDAAAGGKEGLTLKPCAQDTEKAFLESNTGNNKGITVTTCVSVYPRREDSVAYQTLISSH